MKAVVLLSGGLDSSLNLYEAVKKYEVVKVLTFNYGQKAFHQEHRSSKILCEKLNLPLQVVDLTWLKEVSPSSLTSDAHIPDSKTVDIQSAEASAQSAKSVWVPNRNGLFLNIAAVFAEGLGASVVIPGFNYEEAQTFSDNSKDFLQSINHSFTFSTQNHVKAECFSIDWDKKQIIQRALELKMDLSDLWPCYRDADQWCLDCESCLRFVRACESQNLDVKSLATQRGLK